MAKRNDEKQFPHAPDVLERETSDDGFSAGWGFHQAPSESYWINCHTHMTATTEAAIREAVQLYFSRAGAMRVRRIVAMDGKPDRIEGFTRVAGKDDRFLWMAWPHYSAPDLKFLRKWTKKPGFAGLKLHNAPVITEAGKPEVWQSGAWDEMFEFCAEMGKPVLWHVTQRLTDCPYMGGGRNSYWKVGQPKGVKFTNQDLLDVFLDVVSRNPRTRFIGAHHLHIGPESAAKLFRKHPNLSVDLSCGNTVREGDVMREDDRQRWRNYVIKQADRLLFGTDCTLGKEGKEWYIWESLAAHQRFVRHLRLPKEVLEKIAHGNFERLAGLEPIQLDPSEWLSARA